MFSRAFYWIDHWSELHRLHLIKSLGLMLLGGGLTALASKIQIPLFFSPIPITLQSLVVLGWAAFFGAKIGAGSQISLILLGLTGLPVFSAPLPGNLVLMGPTGGYILGFVLAAYVCGRIFEGLKETNIFSRFTAFFIASLFIFIPGVTWLNVITPGSLWSAVQIGFIPFLFGDLLKCFALALLFKRR